MPAGFREREVETPLLRGNSQVAQGQNHRIRFFVGLGHFQSRLLKEQTIEHDQVGLGEQLGNRGSGRKSVGVDPLRHHALQLDSGAANVLHDAGDGRYCADHFQLSGVRGPGRAAPSRQQQRQGNRTNRDRFWCAASGNKTNDAHRPWLHGAGAWACVLLSRHPAQIPLIVKCSKSGSNPNSLITVLLNSSR